MNKILTNNVAQSKLKAKIKEQNKNNMTFKRRKKIRTPEVQVKFPGSYDVFYFSFFFNLLANGSNSN